MLFAGQEAANIDATVQAHPQLAAPLVALLQRQEAAAKNAYATAAIEGGRLTLNDVKRLLGPMFRRQVYELIEAELHKT